jgi:hypothetical protein
MIRPSRFAAANIWGGSLVRDVVCFILAAAIWSGLIAWDIHCGLWSKSEKPRFEKPRYQKAAVAMPPRTARAV